MITAAELAELLGLDAGPPTGKSDAPAVLDVRWRLGGPPGREEYDKGHIPGAVFVDLDSELADPPSARGRHPLPAAGRFGKAMRAGGIDGNRTAVVHDADTSMAAARGWWLLRYFGHPDVRVLDGGLAAWVAAGYPLSVEPPVITPGDFVPKAGGMPVIDATGAAKLARRGVLLDARAPERFRGEQEPIDPVAGHIPGARSVPATGSVDAEGRFVDSAVLRERFKRAGVGERVDVGAYCGSGVTAAHEVLALELAGFPAALYPGSWSEWITDQSRPVATGDR